MEFNVLIGGEGKRLFGEIRSANTALVGCICIPLASSQFAQGTRFMMRPPQVSGSLPYILY